LIEQYFLAACIEHQRSRAVSHDHPLEIAYLFNSQAEAFNPAQASQVGYTHLIADAKRSPIYTQRLEARVQHDLPGWYERCARFVWPTISNSRILSSCDTTCRGGAALGLLPHKPNFL